MTISRIHKCFFCRFQCRSNIDPPMYCGHPGRMYIDLVAERGKGACGSSGKNFKRRK